MEKGEVASREMAVGVGAEMLGRGLIFHVTHRNGFQDKKDKLYRYASPQYRNSTAFLEDEEVRLYQRTYL
jgi:hypothetical protein